MTKDQLDTIYKQYEQMHQSKREWEKYIWQSPIIFTTLITATFAFITAHSVEFFTGKLEIAIIFSALGTLCCVIAYWAHRSRILLRITEEKLIYIEEKYFIESIPKYPINLNKEIKSRLDKLSSTKIMIRFMFVISFITIIIAFVEFVCYLVKHLSQSC